MKIKIRVPTILLKLKLKFQNKILYIKNRRKNYSFFLHKRHMINNYIKKQKV